MSLLTSSSSQPRPVLSQNGKKQPLSATNAPPLLFGSAASTAQTATKLTFWQTLNAIRKQLALGEKENQEVFKGLALKYGPDLALPAFFSVPVVGWIAGVLALPFLGMMERQGAKIIDAQGKQLAKNKDKPLFHAIKLERLWDGTYPSAKPVKPEFPNQTKDTASRMARTWNRFIDRLFANPPSSTQHTEPTSIMGKFWHWIDNKFGIPDNIDVAPALKKKLSIPLDAHKNPSGPMFDKFTRFMNAREGLHGKWYYKLFLAPVDWLYKNIPLPKVVKMITLLPKFSVLAIFYMLKIKPRI